MVVLGMKRARPDHDSASQGAVGASEASGAPRSLPAVGPSASADAAFEEDKHRAKESRLHENQQRQRDEAALQATQQREDLQQDKDHLASSPKSSSSDTKAIAAAPASLSSTSSSSSGGSIGGRDDDEHVRSATPATPAQRAVPLPSTLGASTMSWRPIQRSMAEDGTIKYVVTLEDGNIMLVNSAEMLELVRKQALSDYSLNLQVALTPPFQAADARKASGALANSAGATACSAATKKEDADSRVDDEVDDAAAGPAKTGDPNTGGNNEDKKSLVTTSNTEGTTSGSGGPASLEDNDAGRNEDERQPVIKKEEAGHAGKSALDPPLESELADHEAKIKLMAGKAPPGSATEGSMAAAAAVLAKVSSSLVQQAPVMTSTSNSGDRAAGASSTSEGPSVGQALLTASRPKQQPQQPAEGQATGRVGGKSSSYNGVSWHTQRKRWRAYIYLSPGKQKYLGTFTDQFQAARTYDRAVLDYGLRSPLNFPEEAKNYPLLKAQRALHEQHKTSSSSSSSSASSSSSSVASSASLTNPSAQAAAVAAGERALDLDRQRSQFLRQFAAFSSTQSLLPPSQLGRSMQQDERQQLFQRQQHQHQHLGDLQRLPQLQQHQQLSPLDSVSRLPPHLLQARRTESSGSGSGPVSHVQQQILQQQQQQQQQLQQLQLQLQRQQQQQLQQLYAGPSSSLTSLPPPLLPPMNVAALAQLFNSEAAMPSSAERMQLQQILQNDSASQRQVPKPQYSSEEIQQELLRRFSQNPPR